MRGCANCIAYRFLKAKTALQRNLRKIVTWSKSERREPASVSLLATESFCWLQAELAPFLVSTVTLIWPAMFALIILSVGLAMDAVAVAMVRGAKGEHSVFRAIETGVVFGAAQGFMPLIGWSAGVVISDAIAAIDHWIAFALLSFLGAKMLVDAARDGKDETPGTARSHYTGLIIAAVATSIDAAAAGITLPLLGPSIWIACLIIGLVTAMLCIPAYWLGTRASGNIGKVAEIIGGIVLIALGAGILIEHVLT